MTTAFESIRLGEREIRNRIVMGPMTRNRSGPDGVPTEAMAAYYAQRASAGLIVTEGTQPSAVGQGYPATPGLHTAEQVEGWRRVTDGVHAAGGAIFVQLMHAGRISHPSVLPTGLHPVGPSPLAAAGRIFTGGGMVDLVAPVELDEASIAVTIDDFRRAAERAGDAGFDGVEIHAGNGYLLHQFLSINANRRPDRWGWSPEGRTRLTRRVVAAVAGTIGAGRTGLRVSPGNPYNDIAEPDHRQLYPALARELASLGLAYLHVAEVDRETTRRLRAAWTGPLILNPATPAGGAGPDAVGVVAEGLADLVSFGSLFLANPDLPARLRRGGPFNAPDRGTYYGGGERGYIDYPTLEEVGA